MHVYHEGISAVKDYCWVNYYYRGHSITSHWVGDTFEVVKLKAVCKLIMCSYVILALIVIALD